MGDRQELEALRAEFSQPQQAMTERQELEQLRSELTQQPVQQQPAQQAQPEQQDQGFLDQLRQEITGSPTGSALAELGSAINRGAVNMADFFVGKPAQAIAGLAGQEIPTLAQTELGQAATTGNFMQPGLARDVVRSAGELAAPGAVGGAALRTAAKAVPQVQAGLQTLGQRVTGQLGSGTAAGDVAGAGLAGAGLEVGGEAGEAADIALGGTGETGRQVGEFAGSIAFPIGGAIVKETAKRIATPAVKKLLTESAPTIEGLKDAARKVYKDIDDTGAIIDSRRVTGLGDELQTLAKREGFDADIHPKVNAALKRFESAKGSDLTVTEIDTLRKVSRAAAKSNEADEQRLGSLLINKIDDFLDGLKPKDFKKGGGEIGAKFRDARQLWSRAKKSELLEDAFEKARNQATGFENGIRVQFRQIINNKKKSRGFTAEELDAMKKVVRGGTAENIAKMIGRFGFSEGQASNMLMGSLGVAGGFAVGGSAGGVAVPLIGQVSRNLAQKLTRNNAELTNTIVKAGKNAENVARAYIKAVPVKERSAQELSELLLRPDVGLRQLQAKLKTIPQKHKKLISDAVFFAKTIQDQREAEQ